MIEKARAANVSVMIGSRLLELMVSFCSRKFSDDEILADVHFLKKELSEVYHTLSTFDEYDSEVHSGQLTWSPPHRSEVFWRQNVRKLAHDDARTLKCLVRLAVDAQTSPTVKAVAVHDLGQFIKYYPDGKKILEDCGGKSAMMNLIAFPNPDVKYEALTALQKYMLNRW
jgi:V-type H+-transporting ATPase subunit H